MKAIGILNPKGGAGKSTLASNLAGHLARRGGGVMLGDIDRQQSCRQWLQTRPATLAPIATWHIDADAVARPPKGVTHAVLDTPAGLSDKALARVVKVCARIIVPVQASAFDLWATRQFLVHLAAVKAITRGKADVALVGMRVDPRTVAASQLRDFLADQGFQTLTMIRPTQLYARVAAQGATIFDVPPSTARRELEDWQPLLDWVDAAM